MSKKKDKSLPALLVSRALARFREFSEIAIPEIFKGSTDLAHCTDSLRDFETSDHVGQTLCEIYDGYQGNKRIGIKTVESEDEQAEDKPLLPVHKARLDKVLGRNILEQYRADHGLDKARERLIESLIKQISFEAGVEKLARHIEKRRLFEKLPSSQAFKKSSQISDLRKIERCFPDITAEEIAWLSLANFENRGILFELRAPFFYPVTIVDVNIDGLMLSFGTIDGTREGTTHCYNAAQMVGITGVSDQYQLVPFDHNVSQGIKAIILLSINDSDLFSRMWNEQKDTPIRRGDAMLAKTFLKREKQADLDWEQNLNSLRCQDLITRAEIDRARASAQDYARTKVEFIDCPVRTMLDFAKLIGFLTRVPSFVESQQRFRGYIKLYGANIEFINEIGIIEDSVPLHEHLLLTTSYKFHDQITDVSDRNEVMDRLLDRLRQRVCEEIIDSDAKTEVDDLQVTILERFGIFISVSPSKRLQVYNRMQMMRTNMIDNIVVERSMKFSQSELLTIIDILEDLPKAALSGVRSITKRLSHDRTLASLRTNTVRAACYNPATRQITLSLPIETPLDSDVLEGYLEAVMAAPSQRKKLLSSLLDLEVFEAYFRHCLLHEIGHAIWESMPVPLQAIWVALTPDKGFEPRQLFLTPYAKENPEEDFCECFAIFYTHGSTFRLLAEMSSKVLAMKYSFVEKIWCSDGEKRVFTNDDNQTSLRAIHGNPEDDPEQICLEQDIKDLALESFWAKGYERMAYGEKVLSYEDLEEQALKDEQEQNPIQHAARKFDTSEIREKREETLSTIRIIRLVSYKTDQALLRLKLDSIWIDLRLFDFLRNGEANKAAEVLRKAGAKPKKDIKKTVNQLIRLYQYFREDLETPLISADDREELNSRARTILSAYAEMSREDTDNGETNP